MTAANRPRPLDRYTPIGDLAQSVRWLIRRAMFPATLILVAETAFLFFTNSPGATAFGFIAAGTLLALAIWSPKGIGLPIVPLIAVQSLIVYGLPIVIGHEVVRIYPPEFVTRAGLEVFVFTASMIAAWSVGMLLFHPAPAHSYALQGFKEEGTVKFKRIGFSLILVSSSYWFLDSLRLTDVLYSILPDGSASLLNTLFSATGTCGFFLVAMFVGARRVAPAGQAIFWGLLAANCFISASGFLLSTTTALLASVVIGLFWSSGRMPWRYLIVVAAALSFLNLGKFTMREQYWTVDGNQAPRFTLTEMPLHYGEWIRASTEALTAGSSAGSTRDDGTARPQSQSLLERVNNLQNLLYVMDAIEVGHVAPLHGATYSLIPPLLVPRIFWPDKPRTHEGQILLNVHFGRQAIESTFQTYIAWGLLPEAYGNFGAIIGALVLGFAFGIIFAWVENLTARKLLISLEGFISFTVLLGMLGSFEMVASVLITSVFQSVIVLVAACLPFVQSTYLQRPRVNSP